MIIEAELMDLFELFSDNELEEMKTNEELEAAGIPTNPRYFFIPSESIAPDTTGAIIAMLYIPPEISKLYNMFELVGEYTNSNNKRVVVLKATKNGC